MVSLLPYITLLLAIGLDRVLADSCNTNNCLRAVSATPSLASSFCPGYLKTSQTATTGLPTFLSDCKSHTSKISSACSCFLSSTSSKTLTTSSTEIQPSSIILASSGKSSSSSASSTPLTTSGKTSSSAASSIASASSGKSSLTTSKSSTSSTLSVSSGKSSSSSAPPIDSASSSKSSSTSKSSTSSIASASSSTLSKASTMLTCSSCPTLPASSAIGASTATVTTTITLATSSTCSASAATVTVSATAPSGGVIDQNGCPSIAGSTFEDYVFDCGVGFGPGSFAIGTNPGYDVEDCASQCFLNILGGDCLGVTYTPGSPAFDNFGQLRVGTCTLFSFPDGRVPAPGTALAAFAGF